MKTIRAGEENLEEVANLLDKFRVFYGQESNPEESKKFVQERFQKKDSVIFLAVDEKTSKAFGYVHLYPMFSSVLVQRVWILNDLFVQPENRQEGVGKLLMQKAKEFAKSTKAKRLVLCTAADNKEAQSLYESIGYEKDPFVYYKLDL